MVDVSLIMVDFSAFPPWERAIFTEFTERLLLGSRPLAYEAGAMLLEGGAALAFGARFPTGAPIRSRFAQKSATFDAGGCRLRLVFGCSDGGTGEIPGRK